MAEESSRLSVVNVELAKSLAQHTFRSLLPETWKKLAAHTNSEVDRRARVQLRQMVLLQLSLSENV